MAPAAYDLNMYQGDTFSLTLRLRATNPDGTLGAYLDLTGATPKAQVRDGAGRLIVDLTTTLLDQTVTPGGVRISLTHTQTAALAPGALRWDFQVTSADGTTVTTYLKGGVNVTGEVTM